MRDEFEFIEKKGLWYCDKLIKWLPNESEDEGQEGDSIVSEDRNEWELASNKSHSILK